MLRRRYSGYQDRFKMTEEDFILGLRSYLQDIAIARIEHVLQWLKVNTERFGEKAEITVLFRSFDTWAKELRQSVTICGSKCSSCGLLCLEHKQHEGNHHCNTSHKCPHICSFTDQHVLSNTPECGISYVLPLSEYLNAHYFLELVTLVDMCTSIALREGSALY